MYPIQEKKWTTDDKAFTLIYQIAGPDPSDVSVTITSASDRSPSGQVKSPPITPQTYPFDKDGDMAFSVQSPNNDPFKGTMKITSFRTAGSNDNAGVFCDFFWGEQFGHHFEGVNVTLSLGG